MADRGFSDLLSTASSLLNSQSHSSNTSQGHASKPSSTQDGNAMPQSSSHSQKPSYDEVYASAQVVMNAAKNKLHKPADSSAEDFDYGKLASAAETLIGAASHYGKIEATGYGKYAQKAQEYLHSYEVKHGKPGTTVPASQPSASPGHSQAHPPSSHTPAEVKFSQPSAPPQDYPTAYPPQGYPDAQQGYGGVSQGHSKPAGSYANVENYPPVGYPPAGYPTSGGNYNRPSKYS